METVMDFKKIRNFEFQYVRCVSDSDWAIKGAGKGLVKLIQRVKIAH